MPTYTATGSTTTAFGEHLGVANRTGSATSIPPSYFGTPRGPDNNEYHGVGGFKGTTFPTPRSKRHVTATGWVSAGGVGVPAGYARISTRFGTPVAVPVAGGRRHTVFGTASSIQGATPPDWTLAAGSFKAGGFGAPVARPGGKTYAATGARTTGWGSPNSAQSGRASGFLLPLWGAPASSRKGQVTGFAAVSFGAVSSVRRVKATGYTGTAFGTASASRARTYATAGIYSTRIPLAVATTRTPAFAAVGASTTQAGTPRAKNGGRAIPAGPSAQLGTPNLKQSITC
jgi:hypothetical protein